jgi:hypothetical protein
MGSYMHMGHDTENLVGEKEINKYHGIILSPVNRTATELFKNIQYFKSKGKYDIVLDPQLYFPRSKRDKLVKQPYFPKDFDSTTDYSSKIWWNSINNKLIAFADKLKIDKTTSPVIIPKIFDENYYEVCAETCYNLYKKSSDKKTEILCTVLVDFRYLTKLENIYKITSILSETDSNGYYIVFVSNVEPRREIFQSDELFAGMQLINLLKNTGRTVLVSHCSSDMILYKSAGADHCASGKFFNLRRFTLSRFEEPSKGGGQIEYWFEHSLLAFLRKSDIYRLFDNDFKYLINTNFSKSFWSDVILSKFEKEPKKPWLGDSWRQYLSWFLKTEAFLNHDDSLDYVRNWLIEAEDNWTELDNDDLLFEEKKNDGSWLRSWRQSLRDFRKYVKSHS